LLLWQEAFFVFSVGAFSCYETGHFQNPKDFFLIFKFVFTDVLCELFENVSSSSFFNDICTKTLELLYLSYQLLACKEGPSCSLRFTFFSLSLK